MRSRTRPDAYPVRTTWHRASAPTENIQLDRDRAGEGAFTHSGTGTESNAKLSYRAYKVIGHVALLIGGFAAIALATTFLPDRASAFWPFSSNADAASSGIIPSAATPALSAPTNSNPNSSAPLALATSADSALVPYGGPAGKVVDTSATPTSDRISVYVVRPGDTLSEIATMFGVSVNTIIWANNLSGAKDVHPGDTLIILPVSGVEHTVVKGDTLRSLARKYGADADEIALYNGLDTGAALNIGSTVIIPGGEISAPAQTPSKKPSGNTQPYRGGSGPSAPGYFGNPVPGGIITQDIHGWNGIDIGAKRGTSVYAAADGVVIISRSNGAWNGGYGNYVVITHDNGSQTLYSHLSSAIVSPGQSVSRGQLIGYVGATGRATGTHLHFEVRGAKNPLADCLVGTVCVPR